jgi:hypothetical protein
MPLHHINYFEPKALEKQKMQMDALAFLFLPEKQEIKTSISCARRKEDILSPGTGEPPQQKLNKPPLFNLPYVPTHPSITTCPLPKPLWLHIHNLLLYPN